MPPKKQDPPPQQQRPLSFFARRPPPPSSSAVNTSDPFEPLPPSSAAPPPPPRILAVDIPISTLRPIAFRVFTKKHNLTLKSDALQLLCTFVGRRCGADWRDTGSGEKLLEEVARQWKRNEGAGKILVDGGDALKGVLKGLDVAAGQKGDKSRTLSRTSSFDVAGGDMIPSSALMGGDSADIDVEMDEAVDQQAEDGIDPKEYLRIVDAFDMPKWLYNATRKAFERHHRPSLLPPPSAKTTLFRHRYNILHSRLLRNESFVPPTYSKSSVPTQRKTHFKITPISALLGRSGQNFLLFGMLAISPGGILSLYDPTGELPLDTSLCTLSTAVWFCPGMFVLLDGVFEGSGHFTVYNTISPPPERRDASAEVYGHVDFMGVGVPLDFSSPNGGGAQGRAMRKLERALTTPVWLLASDVYLDKPATLNALREVLTRHSDPPPQCLILCGPFTSLPVSSRAYKEAFDSLAALLTDFPGVCQFTTLILIPHDTDSWSIPTTTGCSPRTGIPQPFLTRVLRAVPNTRATSNPARISYFTSEVVIARDDFLDRIRRNAVRFGTTVPVGEDDDMEAEQPTPADADLAAPRKLVKTILDQGFLSPFPVTVRPLLLDFAPSTLSLCPLPSSLFLCDSGIEGFQVTYEGCHVLNPGTLLGRRRGAVRWAEYRPSEGKGKIVETVV